LSLKLEFARLSQGSYYEKALRHPIAGPWHHNLVRMIRDLLPSSSEYMKHLDLGCGDGLTLRMIKPEGEVFGVDLDPEMLEHAKSRGIKALKANAEDLSIFPDDSFDLITCLETLEHLKYPTLALAESYRVLKHRGFFVITTPNVNLIFRIMWALWARFGMGKYWGRSPHLFEYNLWNSTRYGLSLIERLRDVGFRPEKTRKANFGLVAGVRALKL
jgi:ubiquinone/menaquinone biosynthesis C-methylase UbiE